MRWRAFVASFTDAWIETETWSRTANLDAVASFTDAWIETARQTAEQFVNFVASFTDAWIETINDFRNVNAYQSHLLQMRGLKRLLHIYALARV